MTAARGNKQFHFHQVYLRWIQNGGAFILFSGANTEDTGHWLLHKLVSQVTQESGHKFIILLVYTGILP